MAAPIAPKGGGSTGGGKRSGGGGTGPSPIRHVFVLMLENRSFDHMLGASGITGTDAVTGALTQIDGLGGPLTYTNSWGGATYGPGIGLVPTLMPDDPGHGFLNTLGQLCYDAFVNPNPVYPDLKTGAYPELTNGGFVRDWASHLHLVVGPGGGYWTPVDPSQIMSAFTPSQVPVLYKLATEFAVCNLSYSSMPGPTWPNRMFLHAATSGGLDDGLQGSTTFWEEIFDGVAFEHGSIFDSLDTYGIDWAIYAGDSFPQVRTINNIHFWDISDYGDFASDLQDPGYSAGYTFIEPDYGSDIWPITYLCGNSQHPISDVARGELLIKTTYEAIRNSPHWNESLLIITYDEHGGFYDHIGPPEAIPPGDAEVNSFNQHQFRFERLGVRVPTVVVSPYIAKNTIESYVHDHTSVLRTLEDLFGLVPLTNRDAGATSYLHLTSLAEPRDDCPTSVDAPPLSAIPGCDGSSVWFLAPNQQSFAPVDDLTYGFLGVALRQERMLSPNQPQAELIRRIMGIETQSQAARYLADVAQRYRNYRSKIPSDMRRRLRAAARAEKGKRTST